jgi:hypothetical protein
MKPSCRLALVFTFIAIVVSTPIVKAGDPPPKKGAAASAAKPAASPVGAAHSPAVEPAAKHAGTTTGGNATTSGPATVGAGNHITTSSPHPATTSSREGSKEGHSIAKEGPIPHGGLPAGAEHRVAVSATFHTPVPKGSHESKAPNGAAVRTRADGTRSDIHDPKRGMDIHHGLTGNRRVSVERPDHTRIVAERGGRGYVQHPYSFHGHDFGQRTFYDHGRAYDRFYGRYPYHGGYLEVYTPARFYPVGFYGYAYAPWAAPVPYAWGWGAAPWYGYYGAYYSPYPVYAAPNYWLADFVIAASLAAAFEAGAATADASPIAAAPWLDASPLLSATRWTHTARWLADQLIESAAADSLSVTPMSADVKQAVAEEIKAAVERERNQAQAGAAQEDGASDQNSIAQLLIDGQTHVLVAGSDLDLTSTAGPECALSQGDVIKVAGVLPDGVDTVNATILASKGDKECVVNESVVVAISDLQEMQNHMREQVDEGLDQLQKTQGKNGLPAAPPGATGGSVRAAFAAAAPPPDARAKSEISEQASSADQAEGEVVASVAAAPSETTNPAAVGEAVVLGQSIAAVTASLGSPNKVIDLGAKKIYTYSDKKVIFFNGVVERIEDVH